MNDPRLMDDGEGWMTLEEFVTNNPLVADMWKVIERQAVYINTRRTVEVTARKYRARRGRRRR